MPHAFLGSYRLEADQSFTALAERGAAEAAEQAPDLSLNARTRRGEMP
jgi:hypothetical protein